MARQWRIEYEDALYHVMSRGNEKRLIHMDDGDRRMFLGVLGEMSERFEIELHSWVLMSNHYHLLLKTRRPNPSKGMQWLFCYKSSCELLQQYDEIKQGF